MKKIILLLAIALTACSSKKEVNQVAEVSCGQCQFEMKDKMGCDLAVRLDGKAYFVDGVHIDDFGDAHDKKTGFCEVIRKSTVKGTLENNRFKATSITLVE